LAPKPARGVEGVGTVVAFTPSGFVTVRSASERFPAEGSNVRDPQGRLEGRVVRVFGPVGRPYLLLRPRRPPTPVEGAALLGAEVVRT
jgi:rRNA processing protein Gar1